MRCRLRRCGVEYMEIELHKAENGDCETIHAMQVAAFQPLLKKYRDREASPGAETLETIRRKWAGRKPTII